MPDSFTAEVSDTWTFEISPGEAADLDMVPAPAGGYHLLHGHKAYRLRILPEAEGSKAYTVYVNGRPYEVRLADALDQQIEKMGFRLESSRSVSRIEAPMPGLILSVSVSPGDTVKKGDSLLVLEAMKMENLIQAPQDGVVKKVAVSQGEAVEKKSLLVEFE